LMDSMQQAAWFAPRASNMCLAQRKSLSELPFPDDDATHDKNHEVASDLLYVRSLAEPALGMPLLSAA
jgi:hypothetical protein